MSEFTYNTAASGAKFSDEQIKEITLAHSDFLQYKKELFLWNAAGRITIKPKRVPGIHVLAKKYNVHKSTIWRIVYNVDKDGESKMPPQPIIRYTEMNNFIHNMQVVRSAQHINQGELSTKARLKYKSRIAVLENYAITKIPLQEAKQIATALGVDINDMIHKKAIITFI